MIESIIKILAKECKKKIDKVKGKLERLSGGTLEFKGSKVPPTHGP